MIIGVTGSRDWKDRETIREGLQDVTRFASIYIESILILEGGAPGADRICRAEALRNGWHVATVNALWNSYGKSAGHIRNGVLVSIGAHEWLAFINPCVKENCKDGPELHDSHGAADCAMQAERAGISVRRYGWRF